MKTLSKSLTERLNNNYGPWALVTGSSSGIGKALASTLAEAGLNIFLTGRNEATLQELSGSLEERFEIVTEVIQADLALEKETTKLIEATEDISIGLFIASAGFGTSGHFVQSDIKAEIDMLQVNAMALMRLTHHFGKKFKQQQRGGIILMSSIVGFQGAPNAAHYAATKAYVQSLAEGLYHELKPFGVDVLSAAPGPVHTGFAKTADMEMGNALKPADIAVPILKALGKKTTVFPGRLTKILMFGLRTVPRWGKIRIMKKVMGGMTKHQSS